jgi:hypothetical protein
MVLDENKPFYVVNKYVIDFITESAINDKDKTSLLDSWKSSSCNLKKSMKKASIKRPPRVVSKYLYFCNDERPKIQKEHPTLDIKDITCELGKRWTEFKNNPDTERMEIYTEMFKKDQERYDTAMSFLKEDKPKKKYTSNYQVFCASQRVINPTIGFKELSLMWSKVKDQQINNAS